MSGRPARSAFLPRGMKPCTSRRCGTPGLSQPRKLSSGRSGAGLASFSTRLTWWPARANAIPAASPAMPAPRTATFKAAETDRSETEHGAGGSLEHRRLLLLRDGEAHQLWQRVCRLVCRDRVEVAAVDEPMGAHRPDCVQDVGYVSRDGRVEI